MRGWSWLGDCGRKYPSLLPLYTLLSYPLFSLAHMSVQGPVYSFYVCDHKTAFADDGAGGSSWQSKVWLFGHLSVKRKKESGGKKQTNKRPSIIITSHTHSTGIISIALTPVPRWNDILWGYLDGMTECNFKCILFFFHDYTKSGDEDETEELQYAVAAFCFLGVGPSQVRQLFTVLPF